jgi:hypothetical protein
MITFISSHRARDLLDASVSLWLVFVVPNSERPESGFFLDIQNKDAVLNFVSSVDLFNRFVPLVSIRASFLESTFEVEHVALLEAVLAIFSRVRNIEFRVF